MESRSLEWTPQLSPSQRLDDHEERLVMVESRIREILWTGRLIAAALAVVVPIILGKVL